MAHIIRSIALTGAAAAALLGSAGTVHADTPDEATVAVQAAVDRAAGTPVALPSGRTLHIRGLDTAAHRATPDHHTTVVTLASATTTGLRADTADATTVNPAVNTGYTQQPVQAAGAGTISVTVALGIGLAIFCISLVRRNKVHAGYAFALVAFGIFLAPTVFGPMIQNLGISVGTSLGSIWSGL
ncbi:hypothetical protein OK074_2671 [Actinobacteria bacterium OK074]|nr:hypothetical protein OK074_2671 [Actinobacteria bacterium OK074]